MLVLLLLGSATIGYFYFSKVFSKKRPAAEETVGIPTKTEDSFSLRIYYPVNNRLQMEERRLPRRTTQIAIAEATIEEFLKGPAGAAVSNIPRDSRLLGLYRDTDRILYVDLSDEFRRNFHCDAVTEFLILKGLYESLISNIQDIQDIKVLIEGREIETLGGHLYLSYPLKDMVSCEYQRD
ncbi:MAG: GerMN domain-containing protein [Nitrospirota bacterium]